MAGSGPERELPPCHQWLQYHRPVAFQGGCISLSGKRASFFQDHQESGWKLQSEIGGKTRTMSTTTVDGKTLYPAVDVMGNLLDKVVTGNDGAYAFDNLAEGSYYIVLQDEGDDYAVTGGTRVLPFERLSITPEREDTKNTLTQPGRDTDKALPEYQDTDTTDQGAARHEAYSDR